MIKAIAFDCFGTLFEMQTVQRFRIAEYVEHVKRNEFTPYEFHESWYRLKAHPDVAQGFYDLRNELGLSLIAMSNGPPKLIFELAELNGIGFDYYVDLPKHRVYKPHPKAYACIEKDTGFTPWETLMVTANPTFGDVEGAAAIGMPAQVIRHGCPNDVIELAEYLADGKFGADAIKRCIEHGGLTMKEILGENE